MNKEIPTEIIEALLQLRHAFKSNGLNPNELTLTKISPNSVRQMRDIETGKLIPPDFVTELPDQLYGIRIKIK